jgi:hypothetical protein
MISLFDNISFHQIKVLLNIFYSLPELKHEFIKNWFQSDAQNYKETLDFLRGLKLVKIKDDIIILSDEFTKIIKEYNQNKSIINNFLLKKLINSKNIFSREIFTYLSNFKIYNDSFEYTPTIERRLKESGIRNLFIELGLTWYDRQNKKYEITDNYILDFINYIENRKMTLEELQFILKEQEDLGKAAELEIIKYEKNRLKKKPQLLKYIEHTSKCNILAGYDIKSCELEKNDFQTPELRFIEVKAVSILNYRFNWSRNEIDKSKLYGMQYYLYLLPMIKGKRFDIKKLKIIRDPYKNIFKNKNKWAKQEEKYSVWERR